MRRTRGWGAQFLTWTSVVGTAITLSLAPGATRQAQVSAAAMAGDEDAAATIAWPKDGATVTDNTVAVAPEFKNWKLRCDLAGTKNVPGAGHYHLELDGALVNMYCGPATLSLQNVKPGSHTLTVYPARNDHSEIEKGKADVKFTYQPAAALPPVTGLSAGKPNVQILWPKNGATVSGATFPLLIDVKNYRLSCDLLGKPKVANTGHWHVDVDKAETMMPMKPGMTKEQEMMAMMQAMATMLNMGCNNTFEVPLAGIGPGKHTFFVVLVDNAHEPLHPAVAAQVSVNVKK